MKNISVSSLRFLRLASACALLALVGGCPLSEEADKGGDSRPSNASLLAAANPSPKSSPDEGIKIGNPGPRPVYIVDTTPDVGLPALKAPTPPNAHLHVRLNHKSGGDPTGDDKRIIYFVGEELTKGLPMYPTIYIHLPADAANNEQWPRTVFVSTGQGKEDRPDIKNKGHRPAVFVHVIFPKDYTPPPYTQPTSVPSPNSIDPEPQE